MKKIIIISKEFKTDWGTIDVKSLFYDEEMNPIITNDGINLDKEPYHLGQISSSFDWAKKDMSYERYKDHFDKLFPEANGDFEFKLLSVTIRAEEKAKQLVEEFYDILPLSNRFKSVAKNCALACIDEIERALTDYGKESMELQNMDSEFRYWDSVRNAVLYL